MIPLAMVAPLAEGGVKLLIAVLTAGNEPPEEKAAAWRRITRAVHEANEIMQAIAPVGVHHGEPHPSP